MGDKFQIDGATGTRYRLIDMGDGTYARRMVEQGAAAFTKVVGYEQLTNADLVAVKSLTPPAAARMATIQNNGSQPARWRGDGHDPTGIVGTRIDPGGELPYAGDLSVLRFIREADGATLDVTYWGM